MFGGRSSLLDISRCSGLAADIYPQMIRMMDDAGVPASDRVVVLMLLAQAIGPDVPTGFSKLN